MRPRLAIILSHPTQYYSPWFRWLARHTALKVCVFYLWDAGVTRTRDPRFGTSFAWDVDLLSGYESHFIPNRARYPGTEDFTGLINPSLCHCLEQWNPDAILLIGYAYASHLSAILWARLRGIPLLFRGDSHLLGRPRTPLLKQLLLRSLYANFHAVTFVGRANREYFRTLGVSRSRLFFAPHAVDDSLFNPEEARHQLAAASLKEELGIPPNQRVLLFAGKLYGHKNPRGLLEAFLSLAPENWTLVFVGEGEDKALLQERARQHTSARIHFLPFANQSEMPSRYLLGDVFCLPSISLYETWGLAINEAMHMGRPCLVSDRVGCQRDLITEGITGWVFQASDPAHLRAKLSALFASDPAALRPHVLNRIRNYTYKQASDGLLQALFAAIGTELPAGSPSGDESPYYFPSL